MNKIRPEKRQSILLALTQIHRNLKNGAKKVAWHKEFKQQGFKTSNEVVEIKKALCDMKIIHISRKGEVSWSTEKTLPNPLLIDGIYQTIRENRKTKVKTPEKETKIKTSIEIVINGCPINPTIVSVGL